MKASALVLLAAVALALTALAQDADAPPDPWPTPSCDTRTGEKRSSPLRLAMKAARVIALSLLLFTLIVLTCEKRFIFYPMRHPRGEWHLQGTDIEDCAFRASDGVRLHGWWLAAQADESGPVLLFLHGNAGNVTHRAENMRMLAARGLSVLVVDYRGYGRSEGSPSEKGIYLDAEAAYDYLAGERGIPPGRIVCFGRSLGAAAAIHVALARPVVGLALESPMASAQAMARRMLPWLPIWPLVRAKLDNVGRIRSLRVPLLVLHGDRDEIVPLDQGRAVYDAAPRPKRFYRIEGADHNDTYLVGGEEYFRALVDFCRSCAQSA